MEYGVEFCRRVWSGVLSWSLECSFGVESEMKFGVECGEEFCVEFWRGVWSGVLLFSLEWSFGVESGVHFQSSVVEIYINNFSTCNLLNVHMDL